MNVVVNLYLTWHCNFRCGHCIHECGPEINNHMSDEQFKYAIGFIDWLYATKDPKVLSLCVVGLTGGEPTLHPKFWTDILPKFKEVKSRYNFDSMELHTNGSIPVPKEKYGEYNRFFNCVKMANDPFHKKFRNFNELDIEGYSAVSTNLLIHNLNNFLTPSLLPNDYSSGKFVYCVRGKGRVEEILNTPGGKGGFKRFYNPPTENKFGCSYHSPGFLGPVVDFSPDYINYCGEKRYKKTDKDNTSFEDYGVSYETLINNSLRYGANHCGNNCSQPCWTRFVDEV